VAIYYPRDQDFDHILRPAALRHPRVPLWLAKGLFSIESGWNPDAATYEPSHQNTPSPNDRDASFGLGQVTGEAALSYGAPQVAEALAGRTADGRPIFNLPKLRAILAGPELNIEVAFRELEHHIDRYGGDYAKAVAAYNMGFARTIQQTTPFIAKIYDKWAVRQGYGSYVEHLDEWKRQPPEGWTLANQPYVNDVLARAALYRAHELGRAEEVARIKGFLDERPCVRLSEAIRSLPPAAASSSSASPSPSSSASSAPSLPAASAAGSAMRRLVCALCRSLCGCPGVPSEAPGAAGPAGAWAGPEVRASAAAPRPS
jgi:hypothetical protein